MVEVSGDELERVGGEHGEQLVVGQAEALLEDRCGCGAHGAWRRTIGGSA